MNISEIYASFQTPIEQYEPLHAHTHSRTIILPNIILQPAAYIHHYIKETIDHIASLQTRTADSSVFTYTPILPLIYLSLPS